MDIYFSWNRNPLSQAHQIQAAVKTEFFIGQSYRAGQTVWVWGEKQWPEPYLKACHFLLNDPKTDTKDTVIFFTISGIYCF